MTITDKDRASHTCPTVPVWRPTTFDEIREGWEVRSRGHNGFEMHWGTAHHRDSEGDWRTEAGAALTYHNLGWTYETTAPQTEPWPDELVAALGAVASPAAVLDLLDLLADRGLIERPKAGA